MRQRWRIELLGGLRASLVGPPGGPEPRLIERFPSRKTGLLLAYLAFYPDRSHPRESLIDLFWPEADPAAGRQSLSRALSSLRHMLEPPGDLDGKILVADRASVSLRPDAVTTDVAEFEATLQRAARAAGRLERAAALEAAVNLYRGALLPDDLDNWILDRRGWLAVQFFAAVEELAEILDVQGEADQAITVARRGIEADPLREESHRLLIRLLIEVGRTAAARGQYQELSRLLAEQLGVEPEEATRALVASLHDEATKGRSEVGHRHFAAVSHLAPSALPTGTVTFLLTDIEGSTARWERSGVTFAAALKRHHAMLRQVIAEYDGSEVKDLGDGLLIAFSGAGNAMAGAIAAQRALGACEDAIPVRMALHTGDVEPEKGDYHSLVINHASRVLLAAHGGQILCSETTASLLGRVPEPGVQLADLGVFRLRDLAAPQRLYQVEYPEMGGREWPPPRAEAAHALRLPVPLTRFFGREVELARLEEMLVQPETRLVTLIGAGGTGKTRLSIAVAELLRPAFRGSVWFVALADLTAVDLIPDAIREALGLPRAPNREPLAQAVEHLSRQRSLLVLDNFEHLVEEGADLLISLLKQVPDLTCLVTSRRALGLEGEREFHLSPLPVPERISGRVDEETLVRIAGCPSVRLFVDRAQAVRPEFQVTAGNAAAIAALCRRLEGIPLAMELAAGRARMMTPSQMLARLEGFSERGQPDPTGVGSLKLLVSHRRGAPSRHQSLWAAIDWSYRLLTPELQRFFCRLSVFRGGWSLEAAAAVCDEPLSLELLELLRECSLVQEAIDSPEEIRFRTLETLREFGQESLQASGEADLLKERHARWFLALAESSVPELHRADQIRWLDRLEAEHDNFRQVLEWSRTSEERAEIGLRLVGALFWFWQMRGYLTEGRLWLEELLVRAPVAVDDRRTRALALHGVGQLAFYQGDFDTAHPRFARSASLWREIGDDRELAYTLCYLGGTAEYSGRIAILEESVALAREVADPWVLAMALWQLGLNVRRFQGDLERVERLSRESEDLFRKVGDRWRLSGPLNLLGFVAMERGEHRAAGGFLEESLALQQEVGDRWGAAQCLSLLARVAEAERDDARTTCLYETCLDLFREVGDSSRSAEIFQALGRLTLKQGDARRALSCYRQALELYRAQEEDQAGIAQTLEALAGLAADEDDPTRNAP